MIGHGNSKGQIVQKGIDKNNDQKPEKFKNFSNKEKETERFESSEDRCKKCGMCEIPQESCSYEEK